VGSFIICTVFGVAFTVMTNDPVYTIIGLATGGFMAIIKRGDRR